LKRLGPNLMGNQMLVQLLTWVVCSVPLVPPFSAQLDCLLQFRAISLVSCQILSADAKANGRHPDLLGRFPLFLFSRDSHFAHLNTRRPWIFPAEVKVRPSSNVAVEVNSDRKGWQRPTLGLLERVSTRKFHKKSRKILTRRDYFYFFVPILWRK
jgi:hypothetical protein